jgi:hypothetical protein
MGFGKVKLRPDDILYSKYIRKKARYICERCKRRYPDGNGLQASHYWGRRRESTRFNDFNVSCLCVGCHRILGENPHLHREFQIERIGQEEYDRLMIRANLPTKKDIKLNLLIIKEKMKQCEST